MKHRGLIPLVLLITGHLAWSQSTAYFYRGSFLQDSMNVPGERQTISSRDLRYLPSSEIGPVLTISNITFTGRDLSVSSVGPAGSSVEFMLHNFDGSGPLEIHFANGARAFGADFSSGLSQYFTSFTATVSLNNGERFSFTAPSNPSARFFGFISPTPITDVTFSDGGVYPITPPYVYLHQELIGDVFVVMQVPEPGSAALFALGAAGWLWRRRKAGHT